MRAGTKQLTRRGKTFTVRVRQTSLGPHPGVLTNLSLLQIFTIEVTEKNELYNVYCSFKYKPFENNKNKVKCVEL